MTLLTEAEANKHDCPFMTFVVNETEVIYSGKPPISVPIRCRTSACIAWRWSGDDEYKICYAKKEDVEMVLAAGEFEIAPRDNLEFLSPNVVRMRAKNADRRGHCGVCGKP